MLLCGKEIHEDGNQVDIPIDVTAIYWGSCTLKSTHQKFNQVKSFGVGAPKTPKTKLYTSANLASLFTSVIS